MKAGAFTPAIRQGKKWRPDVMRPLNEGGGFHPRNPALLVAPTGPVLASLNEGGGFHPRNPRR